MNHNNNQNLPNRCWRIKKVSHVLESRRNKVKKLMQISSRRGVWNVLSLLRIYSNTRRSLFKSLELKARSKQLPQLSKFCRQIKRKSLSWLKIKWRNKWWIRAELWEMDRRIQQMSEHTVTRLTKGFVLVLVLYSASNRKSCSRKSLSFQWNLKRR